MHFVDPIEGNVKSGARFWGAIADTYNDTTATHCEEPQRPLVYLQACLTFQPNLRSRIILKAK
jgi:hypothetical protein